MWELVIEWAFGEDRTQVYSYDSKEQAEKAMAGMRMAFGNQITWMGIRPKHFGESRIVISYPWSF